MDNSININSHTFKSTYTEFSLDKLQKECLSSLSVRINNK